MRRRRFIKNMGLGGLAAAATSFRPSLGWSWNKHHVWRMVTSWPKSMPILQTGAEYFARQVMHMSAGQLKIEVHAANEVVKALDVFDAVASGQAQCGHSAAYYWASKIPAAQWFATVPFGLKAQAMNTWIYAGGGHHLWREVYAPYGVVPLLAGNTGIQMGGWFNREIRSEHDFNGLRMRIPGLGGEVISKLGADVVLLPASEIVPALESGIINAAEWIGPYHDTLLGFPKIARYYYAPGWHEPGTAFELILNAKAMEKLPFEIRKIIETAAAQLNHRIFSEFEFHNQNALLEIAKKRKVKLRLFPYKVLRALAQVSRDVLIEQAEKDPMARKVNLEYDNFKVNMQKFSLIRGDEISL
jgi:TRAP-type mannitol/chloroaromatic compound transport system substrate-binding protein